jgi:tetratricopeptide (TPR) repeat protein
MVNSDNGIALGLEILRGIARQSAWPGYLPEPLEVINLPSDRLAPLSGRYQMNSDEAFTLEARDNRLFGKPPAGEEYELFPIAQDLFARKERETRYQIETSDGKVSGILLLENNERSTAKRMRPGAKLPSDDLYAGRFDEATKAYRALYRSKADDPGVAEQRLNRFGYSFLSQKEYAKAIAILRLNTELYATSSNTYDSLAEAYLASGDRVRALEAYQSVLKVLPKDDQTDTATKAQLRSNAEAKIKELNK